MSTPWLKKESKKCLDFPVPTLFLIIVMYPLNQRGEERREKRRMAHSLNDEDQNEMVNNGWRGLDRSTKCSKKQTPKISSIITVRGVWSCNAVEWNCCRQESFAVWIDSSDRRWLGLVVHWRRVVLAALWCLIPEVFIGMFWIKYVVKSVWSNSIDCNFNFW